MRKRLLVVDDEPVIRDVVRDCLQPDYSVRGAEDADAGREALAEDVPDVLLTDVRMPGGGGLELVRGAARLYPDLAIVVITGHATLEDFVEFLRLGVADYLLKPFTPQDLRRTVARALHARRLRAENARLRESAWPSTDGGELLVGESAAMRDVKDKLARVAPTDSTVLLTGSSGTGKELAARTVHEWSKRSDGPFVAVHCGALAHELLESELFGHVRGAFTGAERARAGRFEEADGGTLFLDEIGTMSEPTQVRFLRALAEREITRVGGDEPKRVNVRVVAATNADLKAMVAEGSFRTDLHYRLDVFPVRLPDLVERLTDIPLLARHLLRKCTRQMGLPPRELSQESLRRLAEYDWPGNVRELENVVARAVINAGDRRVVEAEDVLIVPATRRPGARLDLPEEGVDLPALLEEVESELIRQSLERTGNCKQRAARLLGLQRTTLVQKLRRRQQSASSSTSAS